MSESREIRTLQVRLRRTEKQMARWKWAWEVLWARCDAEAKERAQASIESTQEWYAVRHERLAQWAREDLPEPLRTQFFNIYANGTKTFNEPPMLMQLQMRTKHQAERLEKELAALREQVERSCLSEECAPCAPCARDHAWIGDELDRIHELLKDLDEHLPVPDADYEGREADLGVCGELMKRLRKHVPSCDGETS